MTYLIKKTSFLSLVALASLALAACGSQNATQQAPQPAVTTVTVTAEPTASSGAVESTPASSETSSEAASVAADVAGVQGALERALEARAGGTVVKVDRDDDGHERYDVDLVLDGVVHELTFDAAGSLTQEKTDHDAEDINRAQSAQVSAADALSTAAAGRGGQVATDVSLDTEKGILVWEVEFDDATGSDAGTVYVDAATGELVPSGS